TAIDHNHGGLTQAARSATPPVADLAQDTFAAHLESDALGRLGEFIDQPKLPCAFIVTHMLFSCGVSADVIFDRILMHLRLLRIADALSAPYRDSRHPLECTA